MTREAKARPGEHCAEPRHRHETKTYKENGDHCEYHGDLARTFSHISCGATTREGILPDGLYMLHIHCPDVGLIVTPLVRTLLPTHLLASA